MSMGIRQVSKARGDRPGGRRIGAPSACWWSGCEEAGPLRPACPSLMPEASVPALLQLLPGTSGRRPPCAHLLALVVSLQPPARGSVCWGLRGPGASRPPPPAEGGAGGGGGARSGRGMERARRARERSPAAPEP